MEHFIFVSLISVGCDIICKLTTRKDGSIIETMESPKSVSLIENLIQHYIVFELLMGHLLLQIL
jgi:hypothetical protein